MARRLKRPGMRPGSSQRLPAQGLVEFAFVMILFLGLIMAVIEGGRLVLGYFAIQQGASEGARVGAVQGAMDSTILSAVNNAASMGTGVTYSTPTSGLSSGCTGSNTVCVCRHASGSSTCKDASAAVRGDLIDVTVTYNFQLVPANEPAPDCGLAGWCTQPIIPNSTLQLIGYHSARIE